MRAHFGLPSITRDEADAANEGTIMGSGMDMSWKKPIGVKFEILYRTLLFQVFK